MPVRSRPRRARVGLVLSGGGARGAYEVGVLRFIRERLKCDTRFDVITGTSVGAVNGAYIAATAENPKVQARVLQRVWTELSIDRVYRVGLDQLRALPSILFGRALPKVPHGGGIGGLVDTGQLQEIVHRRIPWPAITKNLHAGRLSALAVTATELATGISTTFVQSQRRRAKYWDTSPKETIVPTSITAAHTLASAAIPVLFPAIRVGDQFFVDGMLRQNTPLRPAMRLGADRLLVIGLRRQRPPIIEQRRMREQARSVYPNLFYVLGKMVNALALDRVEVDLERINKMNAILEAGERHFGADFAETIAPDLPSQRAYRKVESVLIRPSEDLGQIAHEVVRRTGLKQYTGLTARLIRRNLLRDKVDGGDSDLASYVLFEPTYVRELIDLGFEDARAHADELLELFEAQVSGSAAERADAEQLSDRGDEPPASGP